MSFSLLQPFKLENRQVMEQGGFFLFPTALKQKNPTKGH